MAKSIEQHLFAEGSKLNDIIRKSENLNSVAIDTGFLRNEHPSCTISFRDNDTQEVSNGLREIADFFDGRESDLPTAEKVHMNDPWTVIEWGDGTKTKTKCHDGDSYNPLYGIIRDIIRKVGRNKVRVDSWEYMIESISNFIENPDEALFLADVLITLYDVMTLDGAMERLADYDVRNDEQVSDADRERFANALVDLSNGINPSQMSQDEMRQMVRNLQLDGEL